jgi:DNA-3-methyladenine glycosylase I
VADRPGGTPEGDAAGLVVDEVGVTRCAWGTVPPEYREYHDTEWGRPVRGERALFERITLEAFQSGLSWLTILRKREAFRAAFDGFDPERVAAYDDADRQRLLADAGIVRNRAKVDAAIANARAVLALRDRVEGGLDALVWSFASGSPDGAGPRTTADVPATTPASAALAKALKAHGLVFVGPTTAYAAMQACGLVDDHLQGCAFRGGGR